ncbi:MAG: Holliday junction resolvase RuvX [Clostridia bacterium]|nr:Holliday junction resolvase RuvX [Clostridia bacterium]
MRTLCLDVGEKRIGVAVSDLLDLTAQGVETIHTKGHKQDLERIRELCAQYETTHILCGLPRNMDGSEGFQAGRIRSFAQLLTESGFEVRFRDERLTSKLAENVLLAGNVSRDKRKLSIDKLAATYILQSFLDGGGWQPNKPKLIGGTYIMNEQNNLPEEQEMAENIVELVDEEGNAVTFEHLMSLEHKGKTYILLVPTEPMEDVEEDELVIMRIEQDSEGNDVYVTIDEETELNEVYEAYLEIAEADE